MSNIIIIATEALVTNLIGLSVLIFLAGIALFFRYRRHKRNQAFKPSQKLDRAKDHDKELDDIKAMNGHYNRKTGNQ